MFAQRWSLRHCVSDTPSLNTGETIMTRSLIAVALLVGCGGSGNNDSGSSDTTGGDPALTGALDCVDGYCTLPSSIDEDLTLTSDYLYVLSSGVFVGDGANSVTLTIEPGVTLYGEPNSFLAIQQHSKIMAVGTADEPIVFTSPQAEGNRNRADWGGLILNGLAPINACSDGTSEVAGCTAEGEGSTGTYGGDDPADSSGSLKYVRVEFGGFEITPENEVNGIAFQGVGSGTSVSYIQVHMNKDDGVEFFGGTVNADHVVVTGAGDDSIDWTEGWTGTLTDALIVQYADLGDRGIEADNNGDQEAALPKSAPTLDGVTILGAGSESVGVLLRAGTAGHLSNIVVVDSGSACLDVDDDVTFDNADAGDLTLTNAVLSCGTSFKDDDDAVSFDLPGWFTGQSGNMEIADAGLDGWIPESGSVLEGTSIGAFASGDDWASNWIMQDAD